uniref:helix-turn-helix domain-containing protein n=1 Tax=Clostridium sp. 12(A) TaxID=1163671 RepID=UPI0004677EA9|nr:helix-turn-helix transcriptional regulator [Clostridium sp. 12(A)]
MRLHIKEKLAEKGMTRYELAKRIGVTYPTITAIYNGDSTSIKLETLEALCKELECTPNEIIVPDDPTLKRLFAYYNKLSQYHDEIKKDDSK